MNVDDPVTPPPSIPAQHIGLLAGMAIAVFSALKDNSGTTESALFGVWLGLMLSIACLWSMRRSFLQPIFAGPISILVIVYFVWLFFSVYFSVIPGTSLDVAFALATLPVGYYVARAATISSIGWKPIWNIIQFAGALVSAFALAEFVACKYRISATFLDANLLAGFLNVFVITSYSSAVSKLFLGISLRNLTGHFFLLALYIAAQAATSSLSGTLCMALVLLPIAVISALRARRTIWISAAALFFAAICTISARAHLSDSNYEDPFTKLSHIQTDSSYTVRLKMIESSLAIYSDHPKYGVGLGMYKLYYPQYRSPEDSGTTGDLAHNDYVQFLLEGGPVLLGCLVLFGLAGLRDFYRQLRGSASSTVGSEQPSPLELAGFAGSLVALSMHAAMNFIFYSVTMSLLFGLLLGHLSAFSTYRIRFSFKPLGRPAVFGGIFSAALLVLSSTLGARGLFMDLISGRCEVRACTKLASDDIFMHKLTAYLTGTQPSWIPPSVYIVEAYKKEAVASKDLIKQDEWRKKIIGELVRIHQITPEIEYPYSQLVEIIKMNSAMAENLPSTISHTPEGLYRKIIEISPQNMQARLELSKILVSQGKTNEAYEILFTQGMRWWQYKGLDDKTRKSILEAAIPLAVKLQHCKDAQEMVDGLRVFGPESQAPEHIACS